jgi:hypothetical protein
MFSNIKLANIGARKKKKKCKPQKKEKEKTTEITQKKII